MTAIAPPSEYAPPPFRAEPAPAQTPPASRNASQNPALGDPGSELGELWQQVLRTLRQSASRAVVDAWLEQVAIAEISADHLVLSVPDEQLGEFVDAHYRQPIAQALHQALGRSVSVELRVDAGTPAVLPGSHRHAPGQLAPVSPAGALAVRPTPLALWPANTGNRSSGAYPADSAQATQPLSAGQASSAETPRRQAALPLGLDEDTEADDRAWQDLTPRLTFGSFVIGGANELAASAALAVADNPGRIYNPLFIHGGVGLGKTHLLHAIGHHARQRHGNLKVRYAAAETYIDDTMSAWRSRDGSARAEVRALYRHNVDLLLVDDVQFLQGKPQIQEEFFHLFNVLHQAGKQIVLSCDRFPSELQEFHDRLRSRFEWGLVAELTPPDRDLRLAILHRKAKDMGLSLPHDTALYLAEHLRNNVRELEGSLTKLSAHARIGKRGIDLQLARSVLGPVIELPSRNLTAEVIQRVTAQHFGLKLTDLKGQKRHRSVVVPRMIAMFLTRKHTSLSYPDIGRAFGGRDHSTAIHACQKIEWQITSDSEIQSAVQAVETALGK